MIFLDQYFRDFKHTDEQKKNAEDLLIRVNKLLEDYVSDGGVLKKNPDTKTNISGQNYGGFRPEDCKIGAKNSAHKTGKAVDIYDPDNHLDNWISDIVLIRHGLFREHPDFTKFWSHLSTQSPKSGKRTFYP